MEIKYILFISHTSHAPALFLEMYARHWHKCGFKGDYPLENVEFRSAVIQPDKSDIDFKRINLTVLLKSDWQEGKLSPYETSELVNIISVQEATLIVALDEKAAQHFREEYPDYKEKCCVLEPKAEQYDYSKDINVLYNEMFVHAETLTHMGWKDIGAYMEMVI